MALAGARASTVFVVVGVIAGLEYLTGWPALAFSRARDILRVEFAPAGVPASLRLVRAAGPDDWLPVKTLREVRLTHKVVEPYQGDYKPAVKKGDAETLPAPWLRSPWRKSAGSWRLASPRTSEPGGRFAHTC